MEMQKVKNKIFEIKNNRSNFKFIKNLCYLKNYFQTSQNPSKLLINLVLPIVLQQKLWIKAIYKNLDFPYDFQSQTGFFRESEEF